MTIQRRANQLKGTPVRLLKRAEGLPQIQGYGAVFHSASDSGTEFRLWDDLVERIMPGAFDRTLKEADVRALFNHDVSRVLGRSVAGTLTLEVDQRGLLYTITPPDTAEARAVLAAIERGDVTGSSFAFVPTAITYRQVSEGQYAREIVDLDLWDVGPVTFPAYASATTGIRAMPVATGADPVRSEFEAWRRSKTRNPQADTDELAIFLVQRVEI